MPANATFTDNADIRKTNESWVNSGAYGIALYVTDASKAPVTITYPAGYGVVPAGSVTLRVGTSVSPPAGTDGTVTIIDQASGKTYDFWQLTGSGSTRTASNGVPHSLTASGAGVPNGGGPGKAYPAGIRAAWVSAAGGLLRGWHFEAGAEINHALAISLMNTQLKSGPVFPIAVAEDGDGPSSYSGSIPMGTRLAIPPSVNIDALGLTTDIGRKVARAAQRYGMYVVDRHGPNSSITLYATPTEVTDAQVDPLRGTNNDLIKIRDALRIAH